MNRRFLILLVGLFPVGVPAQTAEHVDPVTGNYVPTRDALNSDPDPAAANPNRLGNRMASRNAPKAQAKAPSHRQGIPADGLTPAQENARNASYNGRAALVVSDDSHNLIDDSSDQQITADGFVSMGGMDIYTPPGTSSVETGVFAKPDWWPQ